MKEYLLSLLLYKVDENKQHSKKLINLYSLLIRSCSEIIIQKLYKSDFKEIEQSISDYISLTQFLKTNKIIYETDNKTMDIYDFKLLGFITWIVNLIMINKIDSEIATLIPIIYKRLEKIDFPDAIHEMYDELLRSIDFETVRYTRKFFFAFSLLYVDENQIENIINKIKISNKGYNRDYLLTEILNQFDQINMQEKNNLSLDNDFFEHRIKIIKEIIKTKIKIIDDKQKEELLNLDIDENKIINQNEQLKKEFSDLFSEKNNKEDYEEIVSKIPIKYPKECLIKDHSNYFYFIDTYKKMIMDYIYMYCTENMITEKISSIQESIPDNTKILAPTDFYMKISEKENLKYNGNYANSYIIDGNKYTIQYFNTNGALLCLEECLPGIFVDKETLVLEFVKSEIKDDKVYAICELNIKLLVKKGFNFKGYLYRD